MTHSTCCKATDKMTECICNDYDGKGVSACGVPCPIHTPPPVPSEIEGEIREKVRKILDKYGKFNGYTDCMEFDVSHKKSLDDYDNAIDDLTALLTHHTSVQVKEERERIQILYQPTHIWCDVCNKIQPLAYYQLHEDKNNKDMWDDLVCNECRSVIATITRRED